MKSGGLYGPKVWNSSSKYRSVVWLCNNRYRRKGAVSCRTPHISEDGIKDAFMRAFAAIWADRGRYIAQYEAALSSPADITAFNKQTAILTAECAEAAALIEECIAENAKSALNQTEYQKHYDELVMKYDEAKMKLDLLEQEKLEATARKEKICRFLKTLNEIDKISDEFNESLWRETVEAMTIHSSNEISVRFYSGTEIHVRIGDEA